MDSGLCSGTWVLDFNRFIVELRIPWDIFRIPQWKISQILESVFPYMGATKKFILKALKCIYLYFTTGYSTHIVGKWHLGFFRWPYTPLHRGFDSFYGMYLGAGDHYSHMRSGILDLHDNKSPVKNKDGVYSMNLFAEVWSNTRFLFIYLFILRLVYFTLPIFCRRDMK